MAREAPAIPPEEIQKYEEAIQKCFEDCKAVVDAPDWKKEKEEPDVTFFVRKVEGSSFNMVKSFSMIPKPMDVVVDDLCEVQNIEPDMDPKVRGETHQQHLYISKPNKWNDGFIYLALETPTRIVSPRDFLMYRKHFEENGKHYFTQVSIVNDAIQPEVKGFVRGRILTQCFLAEQEGDQIKLTFIVHADPAGSIPAWIYNKVATGQGYEVKVIRDRLMKQ